MEWVPIIRTVEEFRKLMSDPDLDKIVKFRTARAVQRWNVSYWQKEFPEWEITTHYRGIYDIYVEWKGDNR